MKLENKNGLEPISIEIVKYDPSINRNISTHSEDLSKEIVKVYQEEKASAWKIKQTNELLENYETDFGVDRTADLYTILDEYSEYTPIKGIKTIYKALDVAKALYYKDIKKEKDQSDWDYAIDIATWINGTTEDKEYASNKKELFNGLKVKEKELDKYHADLVSKAHEAEANMMIATADVEKYEKRIKENDPTFTQQDYDNYKIAFNDVKEAQKLYKENLDLFNAAPINSDDFETIKNLTLKTYDNLQMVENNIANSITSLASGLTVAAHELTVPELMKWAGVDIESEEGLDTIFGEEKKVLLEF